MSKQAMKLAISRLEWFVDSYPHDITTSKEEFLRPFKEALAKQEQGEPVAPNHSNNSQNSFETRMNAGFCGGAQKQEQGEPVAWLYPEGLEALQAGKCWTAYPTKHESCTIPLSLCTPQQRKPLNKQQRIEIIESLELENSQQELIDAVEAAHGIKE